MKKGFIYLLRTYGADNNTLIKLGYTSNITLRLKQYKGSNPFIEVLNVWEIERAKDLESFFHSMYKSKSGNEWYSEDILKVIERIMNNPGAFLTSQNVSLNFKDVWLECKNKNKKYIRNATNMYPYLPLALKKIGDKKMEQLEYNHGRVIVYLTNFMQRHGIEDIYF